MYQTKITKSGTTYSASSYLNGILIFKDYYQEDFYTFKDVIKNLEKQTAEQLEWMESFYLYYFNNYLTLEAFAEDNYKYTLSEIEKMLELGKYINNNKINRSELW
jgi:hypothetical protein